MSMSDLMKAFRKIDTNGDGFITAQELQRKLTKVSSVYGYRVYVTSLLSFSAWGKNVCG